MIQTSLHIPSIISLYLPFFSVFILFFFFQLKEVSSTALTGTIDLSKASIGISIQNQANSYYYTGKSINNVGDFNGDGYDDIGIKSQCEFYIIYGSSSIFSRDLSSLSISEGISITGKITSTMCSLSSIAGLGDVNSDGFDDFILGFGSFSASTFGINPVYYVIYGTSNPGNINLDNFASDNLGLVISQSPLFTSSAPTEQPTNEPTEEPGVGVYFP